MTPLYELSRIDDLRFRVRTAKAKINSPEQLAAALAACRAESVRLVIFRVPVDAHSTVIASECAGARLMDTLCYFERPCSMQAGQVCRVPVESDLSFRFAAPEDAGLVETLAYNAFEGYTGHYHNDVRLSSADVGEVYPSWAKACCEKSSIEEPVVIVSRQEAAVGFAALRRTAPTELDVALLGIVRSDRGRGTASLLLAYLVESCAAFEANRLTYSTQLSNVSMQRLLARAGFLPTGSVYTFHYWTDETES